MEVDHHHQFPLRLRRLSSLLFFLLTTTTTTTTWGFVPTTTTRTSPLLFSLQQELLLLKQRQNEDWTPRNGKRFSSTMVALAASSPLSTASAKGARKSSAKMPKAKAPTYKAPTSKAAKAPTKGAKKTKGSVAKMPKKTTTTNKATTNKGARKTKGSAKMPKKTKATNKITSKAKTKGSAAKMPKKATTNKATNKAPSKAAKTLDRKTESEVRGMVRRLELIAKARLNSYDSTTATTTAATATTNKAPTNKAADTLDTKTVAELRQMLRDFGLVTTGRKDQLIARLSDYYSTTATTTATTTTDTTTAATTTKTADTLDTNTLDTKTVVELRQMLRDFGLVTTGRKDQLIARLCDYYSATAAATPASSPNRKPEPSLTKEIDNDLGTKTVPQLKELLRSFGLYVSGTKADLVARLQEHYAQEEEEEPTADDEDMVASLEDEPKMEANGQTPPSMPTTTTLLKEEEEEEPTLEANGQTPEPMPAITTTTTTTATTLLTEEDEPKMEANDQTPESMPTTTTTPPVTPEEPGWLWTVPMLKERCRELGLPVSGRKAQLLARLENAATQTAAMNGDEASTTSMEEAALGGDEIVAEEDTPAASAAEETPSFAEQEQHRPVMLNDLVKDPQYNWESLHTSRYTTAYFLRDGRYSPFRPEMVGNNNNDKGPRVFLEPRWIEDDRVAVLMGPAGSGKTIELAGSSVIRNADFAILPDLGPLLRRRSRRRRVNDDDDENEKDLLQVLGTFAERYQKDLEAVYDLKAAQGATSLRIVVGMDDASKLSDLVQSIASRHQNEVFQAQLVHALFPTRSGDLDVRILFSVAGRAMSWVYTGTNSKSFDILRPLAVDYSNEAEAARRMHRS